MGCRGGPIRAVCGFSGIYRGYSINIACEYHMLRYLNKGVVTKALTVSESHPLLRSHSVVTHCSENHITDVQSTECESLCSCGGLFHVRSSECDSVLLWDPGP